MAEAVAVLESADLRLAAELSGLERAAAEAAADELVEAALVVPEPPERAGDDDAREAIAAAIERLNATLDPRERIEAHAVIGDAWLPGTELTETLKLRRTRIAERYAAEIEELYA